MRVTFINTRFLKLKNNSMKELRFRVIANLAISILLCLFVPAGNNLFAQDSILSKKSESGMKNIIKYNVSGMLLYDKSIQFGYERMINSKQSISVFGGPVEFPSLLSIPSFSNVKIDQRGGYTFGADYRFYISKENKYPAPHGIYLAPFIANYHFNTDRSATYTDSLGELSQLKLNTKTNFLNIGCQLGYQFIFKKHFTVDLVMFGPAITSYKFSAKAEGEISDELKNKLNQEVIDELINRLPLLNELSKSGEASKSGVQSFWSAGFRYNISIGYRF